MHLPDGLLTAPIALGSAAVSAACVGWALSRTPREMEDRRAPLLGVASAFVFAAQTLNFPIGPGVSGHFVGAYFVMALLGPAAGLIAMSLTLTIQCLLLGDGGLTALGANIMNMGVIGGLGGCAAAWVLRRAAPRSERVFLLASGAAAWFSVALSSAACAAELGASGVWPLRAALPAMLSFHALIGVAEAAITVGALRLVRRARPDLIHAFQISAPAIAAAEAAA